MSNTFIQDALRQVYLTEDAEEFSLNVSGPDDTESFMDIINSDDYNDELISDVYDLEAEAKEDLKQSYIGKVILDCNVCHSNVFFDKDEITEDEDGNCCIDIECPYCMSNEGYTIIGEVKPYQEAGDVDIEDIESDEVPEEESAEEESAEDIEMEEDEGLDEGLKADEVKELRGNEKINGADGPLKAVDKLKGSDEIRGPKYTELNEACDGEEEILTEDAEDVEDAEKIKINEIRDAFLDLSNDPYAPTPFYWGVEDTDPLAKKVCDLLRKKGFTDGDNVRNWPELVVDDLTTEEMLDLYAGGRKIKKIKDYYLLLDESLTESIEDVTINTEDETMTMTTKEDGGVVVETSPNEGEFVEEEPVTDGEMIAPLEPETEADIEAAIDNTSDEEEIPEDEMIIDEPGEDEDILSDEDFEEFDEDSFDNLGESYLKRCYENVTSFKTSNISLNENKEYIIEGKIGFDSGNEKKTQFIFSPKSSENGKIKLEGYNKQISNGKKTFKLNCSINNKALICESLNYNYKSKNDLNESVRVYGTVKRK